MADDDIIEFTGPVFTVAYDVSVQGEGALCWDRDQNEWMRWDGTDWTAFGGLGDVVAGTGLTKTGNTVNFPGGDGFVVTADAATLDYEATAGSLGSIGTSKAVGSSAKIARADHVHDIADGAIDASALFGAGVVDTAALGALQVTTAKIAADAIDGTKLADDAVDSEHYAAGSIDNEHLAADCVNGAKIADDSIDSEHIAADSLDTEHYAAGSVDATALGADCVTAAKIGDDVINSEHYAAGSIDTEHIADDQVTLAKVGWKWYIEELAATGTTWETSHICPTDFHDGIMLDRNGQTMKKYDTLPGTSDPGAFKVDNTGTAGVTKIWFDVSQNHTTEDITIRLMK